MNITITKCDGCGKRIINTSIYQSCEICPDGQHFHKKCIKKIAGVYCCEHHADVRGHYVIVHKYVRSTVKSLNFGVNINLDDLISRQSVIIGFSENEICKFKAYYSDHSNAIIIGTDGKEFSIGLHDHEKFKRSFKDLCISVIKHRINITEKAYKATFAELNRRKKILAKLEANKV